MSDQRDEQAEQDPSQRTEPQVFGGAPVEDPPAAPPEENEPRVWRPPTGESVTADRSADGTEVVGGSGQSPAPDAD